jgi:hypothetical protein
VSRAGCEPIQDLRIADIAAVNDKVAAGRQLGDARVQDTVGVGKPPAVRLMPTWHPEHPPATLQ